MNKQEWEEKADDIYNEVMSNTGLVEGLYSAMHFSFAHIVWEDGNFLPSHIDYCIQSYNEGKYMEDVSEYCAKKVLGSLEKLKLLPDYKEEWFDEDIL